jgi:hypothetical protein
LATRIFLSHSKERGRKCAQFFHEHLSSVFQDVVTWISTDAKCLPQGPNDTTRIVENARNSDLCISFLDKESAASPWILFEPGIFFGTQRTVLVILLGDLTHQLLKSRGYPLDGYHAYVEKSSLETFFESVNLSASNLPVKQYYRQRDVFINDFINLHNSLYP